MTTLVLTLATVAKTNDLSVGSFAVIALLAATLTVVEGLSGRGLDNVFLPAVAASLLVSVL